LNDDGGELWGKNWQKKWADVNALTSSISSTLDRDPSQAAARTRDSETWQGVVENWVVLGTNSVFEEAEACFSRAS